jgi:hypothetical protein
MKKVFPYIAVLSLLFMSCDKVLIPQQPHTTVIPTNDTIRKIFIEDFTGHTCPNCPPAAHKLDSLKAIYPEQIIGMAVHIDFFAIPCPPNPQPLGALPGTFSEDFRTTENADYESIYGCSAWPYPNGLINRRPDPINASLPTGIDFWASSAAILLADSMTAYIKINPTYSSSSGTLNVTVTGEFLCDTTGNYNIALYLVEDDLHGSQTDDDVPGGIINNYTFNDVFRGCINTPGTINGEALTLPATITGHTPINYTSPAFLVNSNFNAANCKIIAVLINTADGGILQAAECDLQ